MADETELVERLRAHSSNFEAEGLEGFAGVCAEAADTIEALQRERDALREALDGVLSLTSFDGHCVRIDFSTPELAERLFEKLVAERLCRVKRNERGPLRF